jgi:hypothetical protein
MDVVDRLREMSLATSRDDLEALLDDAASEITRLRQDLSTAIERAAKVAEEYHDGGVDDVCLSVARAIRSLKTESST